jgi:hypothetical protein
MSYANQHFVYLNNQSIVCFLNGNFDTALAFLTAALKKLHVFDHYVYHNSTHHYGCHDTTSQTPNCASFMEWVKMCVPSDIFHDGSTEERFMYGYALALSPNLHDWAGEFYHRTALAVLEYNVGFILHWRAMKLGLSSELPVAVTSDVI